MVRGPAEIGVPNWQFGSARYAFLSDGSVAFARRSGGYDTLCVRGADGTVTDLDVGFSAVAEVRALSGGALAVVAGSATAEDGVHRIDLPVEPAAPDAPAPRVTTLRPPRDLGLDPADLSVPEAVTFGSVDAEGGEPHRARAVLPAHQPGAHRHRPASCRRCW